MTTSHPIDAHRYEIPMPTVGIRPIVDRRKLVKHALSDMTMELAHAVAAVLREEIKLPNGQAVECIVPDHCISTGVEVASTQRQFAQANVGVIISVASGWAYPLETLSQDSRIPQAIWGFNGTERPGAVYLAALNAAHNQIGVPIFKIYGRDVQDIGERFVPTDVRERLVTFTRAALAQALMVGRSYLSIGSVSMGIAGCIVNEDFYRQYLGMRTEYVDMVVILRRIDHGVYDHDEYQKAVQWVRQWCREGNDTNPEAMRRTRAQKDKDWEFVTKSTMIVRDLMIGNPKLHTVGFEEEAYGRNAIIAGFQGQREWTDHYPNGDFTEAMLNSSFDWNGRREPFIVATENDNLNAVSMLFNHLISHTAQIFADVRTYWSPDAVKRVTGHTLTGLASTGIIHLSNSGPAALDGTGQQTAGNKPAMKPFWQVTDEEMVDCLRATTWQPSLLDQFLGGGYSSAFISRGGMPVTMTRVSLIAGLGPVIQIAEGYTVDLPDTVALILTERTNPTWPSTWFVPILNNTRGFRDVYSVMENWGSNHCALGYGHIGRELITLAAILRIPVASHNVDDKLIFRPSIWGAFGLNDLDSADFRACGMLGPLHR